MSNTADPKTSPWTAEFADAGLEAGYRHWNHAGAIWLARLTAILIVVATLPYGYSILLRFGSGPDFAWLLAVRLAVTAVALCLLAASWRGISHRRLDQLVLLMVAAVVGQTILLAQLAAPVMNILDVQVILVLLFIYVFAPTRFAYKVGPCLILTFAFLAQIVWCFTLAPGERVALVGWLVAANFFGIYACHYWERLRRRQYATQERLRQANAELAAMVKDLERARADAERDSQAKSQFLANVSHELRTPLNAIIGFSEVMKARIYGPLGDARYGEYLEDIHGSGSYLLNLINDLLDLAKVEAGKLELQESRIDIAGIVADAARMLQEEARRRGVTIAAAIPPDLPSLRADARACRQILLNLLSNAVKFSPDGAQVTVSARIEAGGDLLLSVTDAGPGIASEDLAKVVEPFGQAAAALLAATPGTGLGLPLAISLANAHGGSLELRSTPGGGTTVEVRFPAGRLLPASDAPPANAPPATDRS